MCAVKGQLRGESWVDVHSCAMVKLWTESRDLYILYFMQVFDGYLLCSCYFVFNWEC
jgi:hypothetical protein